MRFAAPDVELETLWNGGTLLRSRWPPGPIPRSIGDWVAKWAQAAPERVFIVERHGLPCGVLLLVPPFIRWGRTPERPSPSIDRGEIMDKGYINGRVVLRNRASLIEAALRRTTGAQYPAVGRIH